MRILLVATRVALPATRGQQLRTDEWLRALADHELSLVGPSPADAGVRAAVAARGVEAVWYRRRAAEVALAAARGLLRGLPAQEALYDTRTARRAVAAALRRLQPEVLVVQTLRCGWAVEVAAELGEPSAVLFDAIDSMALHYRHRAARTPLPWRRAVEEEARRCARREAWLAARSALSTAVAARDLAALGAGEHGRVVPVSGRAPAAVPAPAGREPIVLLSGNLGYRPTVDAAVWFAHHVWPEVHRRRPDARWLLAGARPARPVRRLALLPGVEVHAEPPDLAEFLARAAVAVAPMATGSGIPLKVLEAWAAGVPVVATPFTAAGLTDQASPALAVADSPAAWVEAVAGLLADRDRAAALAAAGRRRWQETYSFERVADAIRQAVAAAARTAAAGGRTSSG